MYRLLGARHAQKRGLCMLALSFCLSVRLFVRLSPEMHNADGGGGLSRRTHTLTYIMFYLISKFYAHYNVA